MNVRASELIYDFTVCVDVHNMGNEQVHHCVQVVSIPFHIWSMLGTLPLRAAYLQQLLHICQVLQFQPSPPTPPTHLKSDAQRMSTPTYSNSNIEAINLSALAAQWANPAHNRGSSMAVTHHASPHSSAVVEAASQLGSHDTSATLVNQHPADANERSASIKQRTMSRCSGYERLFQSMPSSSPQGSMQGPMLQGLAHISQTQAGQGLAQPGGPHSQGVMQCTGLRGLRTAESAAMRQSLDTTQSMTPSPWAGSPANSTLQQQQGQSGQQGQEAWPEQGLEAWAGQGPASPQDGPLNAAEYEAVMNLQSLALQLQAAGMPEVARHTLRPSVRLRAVDLFACLHALSP